MKRAKHKQKTTISLRSISMSLIWWQKVWKFLWQLSTTSAGRGKRSIAGCEKQNRNGRRHLVCGEEIIWISAAAASRNCVREISLPFNDFLLRTQLGCTNCRAKKLRFNLTFLSAFDSPLSPSTSWSDFRDRTPRSTRVLPLWRCSSLSSFNFHCTISRLSFKQTFFHFRDANSPFSMVLSTQTPIHG